jgi:hypothetical protein
MALAMVVTGQKFMEVLKKYSKGTPYWNNIWWWWLRLSSD